MKLKSLREAAGLRVIDVAHALNCSESTIRNWEHGRSTPKMEAWQAFKLRDLYKVSEEDLTQAIKDDRAV